MDGLNPALLPENQCYTLDTVTIIYFLEKHPRYYQTAKEIFEKVETGKFSANISTLVFTELLVPAYRTKENKYAEKIVTSFLTFRILRRFP